MRFFVPGPLAAVGAGGELQLSPGATRHAQVRRVQPGDLVLLFDGQGIDWPAQVLRVGRSAVVVRLVAGVAVDNELPWRVTLALGMPANERMDMVVEKATELGAAALQPLVCERSVLRLAGERAERKRAHWQAVAEAACEQCGRARVPVVAAVQTVADWLATLPAHGVAAPLPARLLLSLQADARPLAGIAPPIAEQRGALIALSGPEGGLTPAEEAAARAAGFAPVALGPRVLRADTAPLALLAWLAVRAAG